MALVFDRQAAPAMCASSALVALHRRRDCRRRAPPAATRVPPKRRARRRDSAGRSPRAAARSPASGRAPPWRPPARRTAAESCAPPSGAGSSLKFTTAMAASVPNDPIMSLAISRPATFLTTMPPDCTSLPSSVAKRHADHQVARRAVEPPARPAGVGGDHAAHGGGCRRTAGRAAPSAGSAPASCVNSRQGSPASTLMVRSRGSYWSTRRSAGGGRLPRRPVRMGPAIRRLLELPASAMVRSCAAASRSASRQFRGSRMARALRTPARRRTEVEDGQHQRARPAPQESANRGSPA